ncbi:unnamed protein product [Ixodes persulcatus]
MRALPLSCSLLLGCFFHIAPLLCPSPTRATSSHDRHRRASSRCNVHVEVPLAGSLSLTLTTQASKDCKPAKDTISFLQHGLETRRCWLLSFVALVGLGHYAH